MTINFICQSCKKKVKAPEATGGKWGNCPHCNLKCYIPLPPEPEEEELTLMPVEQEDEKEQEQKIRELEIIFDRDVPWIMLSYERSLVILSKDIKNYRKSGVIRNYFKYIAKEK